MTWRNVSNRINVASRDEYRTNQNALICDVTYFIYATNCR